MLRVFGHIFFCVYLVPSPQVAIIAGNFDLAEIIKVHKSSDVGKLNCDASGEHPSAEVDGSIKKAERFWTGKLCHLVRTGENVLLCHRKGSLHTQFTNADTLLMRASSNPDFYIIYLRFDRKSVSILYFQFVTDPSFNFEVGDCLLSVPFRETPSYTNRRRAPGPLPSPRSLLRSASDNNLNGDHDHIHSQAPRETRGRRGHSPVPSLRSLPAFGQQHSSLGEVS